MARLRGPHSTPPPGDEPDHAEALQLISAKLAALDHDDTADSEDTEEALDLFRETWAKHQLSATTSSFETALADRANSSTRKLLQRAIEQQIFKGHDVQRHLAPLLELPDTTLFQLYGIFGESGCGSGGFLKTLRGLRQIAEVKELEPIVQRAQTCQKERQNKTARAAGTLRGVDRKKEWTVWDLHTAFKEFEAEGYTMPVRKSKAALKADESVPRDATPDGDKNAGGSTGAAQPDEMHGGGRMHGGGGMPDGDGEMPAGGMSPDIEVGRGGRLAGRGRLSPANADATATFANTSTPSSPPPQFDRTPTRAPTPAPSLFIQTTPRRTSASLTELFPAPSSRASSPDDTPYLPDFNDDFVTPYNPPPTERPAIPNAMESRKRAAPDDISTNTTKRCHHSTPLPSMLDNARASQTLVDRLQDFLDLLAKPVADRLDLRATVASDNPPGPPLLIAHDITRETDPPDPAAGTFLHVGLRTTDPAPAAWVLCAYNLVDNTATAYVVSDMGGDEEEAPMDEIALEECVQRANITIETHVSPHLPARFSLANNIARVRLHVNNYWTTGQNISHGVIIAAASLLLQSGQPVPTHIPLLPWAYTVTLFLPAENGTSIDAAPGARCTAVRLLHGLRGSCAIQNLDDFNNASSSERIKTLGDLLLRESKSAACTRNTTSAFRYDLYAIRDLVTERLDQCEDVPDHESTRAEISTLNKLMSTTKSAAQRTRYETMINELKENLSHSRMFDQHRSILLKVKKALEDDTIALRDQTKKLNEAAGKDDMAIQVYLKKAMAQMETNRSVGSAAAARSSLV